MLPPSKHAAGLAGFAVTATFAPAIGPTIGGYFTDNFGWPYCFYVNLVPGSVMLGGGALWYALPKSPMRLGLWAKADWRGIALMAVGLAAFQTVLDDGNADDWFGSPFIVELSLVAAVALGVFVVLEFIDHTRAAGQFPAAGPPQFRAWHLGHVPARLRALCGQPIPCPSISPFPKVSMEQAARSTAWTGLPQPFVILLVPLLMRRIDARLIVGTGLFVFAASCFMNLHLDVNYAAPQLLWPDIIRALGQAVLIAPLSAIAMVGIASNEAGAASGLFNMMRNLGGAIGTAAIETFFTKREQFHSFIIDGHVSLLEPATRDRPAGCSNISCRTGSPTPPGRCTAPSSPSARRSAPRLRSWVTPTALPYSAPS